MVNLEIGYGEALEAMLCNDCKLAFRMAIDNNPLTPTKNPVKLMRQAKRLMKIVDDELCFECRQIVFAEGYRWHKDHPGVTR